MGRAILMAWHQRTSQRNRSLVCARIAGTCEWLHRIGAPDFIFASDRLLTRAFRNIRGCRWFSAKGMSAESRTSKRRFLRAIS